MRPAFWVALLVGWTVLTAPLGILLLAAESCDDDDLLCLDFSPIGEILVFAWLAGSTVIIGLASARRPGRQNDSQRCPRCGRGVTAGSPTCLHCGYNLVAGR